ncbi:G-rich sequence factor 1 isoform X1 [Aquarana catesbeiana]|uniref:G-rich sequence factor 1 isoform X1 n=2 Tax=Aquarana catesbeiana TaxID=8400 RepID=UPI003CC99412
MAGSCRVISASIAQLVLRGRGAALLRRGVPGVQSCLLGGLPGRVRAPGLDRPHSAAFYTNTQDFGSSSAVDDYPPLPDYDPHAVTGDPKKMFIVRARGLPWSCTAEDVLNFFSECNVSNGIDGVHFIFNRDGKPRGDAIIEFETADDLTKALEQHKKFMGQRYVEVFEMSHKDAELLLHRIQASTSPTRMSSMPQSAQALPASPNDTTVRLRGLPYSCTEQDIINFFSGLSIADEGITFVLDQRGRKSGEAFVQFVSQENAEQALQKHKQEIGSRYIEIFPSRRSEIQNARLNFRRKKAVTFAPSMKDFYEPDINHGSKDMHADVATENNDIDEYVKEMSGKCMDSQDFTVGLPVHDIHIRGLPFHVSGQDIANFFHPVMPLKINIEFSADAGGTSGEAVVRFLTHEDAIAAMAKNRCHMQQGYLELFLNSSSDAK